MGMMALFKDGLQNLVANLGTARDKSYASEYVANMLDPGQLNAAYRGAWLPRKIVDIPAFDACREWRLWKGSQAQIEALEKIETALNIQGKVMQAIIAARLYGGCALYIGTGDVNPQEPLDVERIGVGGLKHLTLLPMSRLRAGDENRDIASEWYGKPAWWQMNTKDSSVVNVHPSRLVIFMGAALPEDDMQPTLGWGDSVLNSVWQAVTQADAATANIASLMFEAKVDVVRIPNLMQELSQPGYESSLIKRFQLAAMGKGINGMLILDKEEEYDQKAANFGTLPELMDRFYQNVSGACDIPMTRLFGRSPAGMNATGDSDIRNYYDRVAAIQELEMSPAMARLDECLIRSALGSRPAEVYQEWAPLWQESERSKAEIGKIIAETAKQLSDMQLYTPEALSEATTNALTEAGAMAGLEGAVDRHGLPESPANDLEQTVAALAITTPQI